MVAISGYRAQVTDRPFFLTMAIAIAVTVAVGFGIDITRPQVAFASAPLHVHLHGAVFSLWILYYLAQNLLVMRGSVALHRTLGAFGVVLMAVMVVLGIVTTVLALRLHRVSPFFPPGVFLVLDTTAVLTFAGLTCAALVLRANAAWHKRLMLCGTIMVMSPALGRLLPMPQLGPWSTWAVSAAMLLYVVVGMLYDKAAQGRVHPAYAWGAGAIILAQFLIVGLAFTPPVLALAAWLKS
jgi:hypothetical protein